MVQLDIKEDYRKIVGVILLVHLLFLFKLMFTAWPEMLLWPYLMLKGLLPYKDIAIAHTPLMLVDLSVFYKLFGVGVTQLKLFTWILVLLADGVLFYVVKKFWDIKIAIFSLITFVVWQLFYDGNGLWFDLYMGLLTFVSFYFVKRKEYGWAGIAWGLTFISKQTAVWFLIPIFYSLYKDFTGTRFRKLVVGGFVVASTMSFILYLFNLWPSFVHWAIEFGIFTLPRAQGQINYPSLRQLVVYFAPFAIFLPLFARKKSEAFTLSLWTLAGILGAYPRFELFHFQPAIFYLAIASGLVFAGKLKKPAVKLFVLIYVFSSLILFGRFVQRNWNKETRFYDKTTKEVASKVADLTKNNQYIYVLNYWDNIYPLTNTTPAVDPWVPYLPWYVNQPRVEETMLGNLEKNVPGIVIKSQFTETGLSSFKAQGIVDFIEKNYKSVDTINGVEILKHK